MRRGLTPARYVDEHLALPSMPMLLPLCVIGVLAITAASSELHAQDDREVAPRPLVDHHAHLKSPAVARLFHYRLAPLELPPALNRVLKDFELHWHARDQAALAALFTEEGIMQFGDAWRRGRPAIRVALLDSKGADIRFWAQAFGTSDSLAYIVGSYGHRTLPHLSDLGRLHLTLRLERDGIWRIAAAVLGNVNPTSPSDTATFPAKSLIAQLDSAGTRRAAVMSWAYQFGSPAFDVADEHTKVRAENDWTAQEAARYPDRLVAFCSFSPIASYAMEELDRCMRTPGFTGLKLHFTSSFVDLRNAQHVERLRGIFRAANGRRFPIVVHMRTLDRNYGRQDAEVFLREILAAAPDVPVQIAHAAGWSGYGAETDAAFALFAEASAVHDPRMAKVYFDLSGVVTPPPSDSVRQLLVRRIREIGVDRMLFAVDRPEQAARARREAWEHLKLLPLDAAELRMIAANVAPYLR
jgi:predicted TIM-barrel fold metal-dependent hydrolase